MSDRAAMLACSGYFLGCPRPCLTRAREAKIAEGDLVAGSIRVISARDVSVWGVSGGPVSARNASARDICVDAKLFSISSWLSIK